jgi:hypothetical protein
MMENMMENLIKRYPLGKKCRQIISMNINVPSENSESGTLLKVIGGVVFLLILIVIYMISRQYAKMQETIRRMEIQNEVAAKPQVVMETLSLEPVITSSNISTNGRCGPEFNNTICSGNRCCSTSSWCGGSRGTRSAWCANKNGYIGRDGGKYDGTPPPSSNVSTNGRCGPEFNNTICPGKQCCSTSSWCAGTQGTKSAWCADRNGYKGRDGGKYDGKSN